METGNNGDEFRTFLSWCTIRSFVISFFRYDVFRNDVIRSFCNLCDDVGDRVRLLLLLLLLLLLSVLSVWVSLSLVSVRVSAGVGVVVGNGAVVSVGSCR